MPHVREFQIYGASSLVHVPLRHKRKCENSLIVENRDRP